MREFWIKCNEIEKRELDSLASELVELHEELQIALASTNEVGIVQEEGARVENLGHGVYVQYSVQALDIDAIEGKTATSTKRKVEAVVITLWMPLQGRYRVAVTVQPSIGTTRGFMTYAIQYLLSGKPLCCMWATSQRDCFYFCVTLTECTVHGRLRLPTLISLSFPMMLVW